jgi:hypothetical protein
LDVLYIVLKMHRDYNEFFSNLSDTQGELIEHQKESVGTGGMAEVAEHLLCKHKALSSNPI